MLINWFSIVERPEFFPVNVIYSLLTSVCIIPFETRDWNHFFFASLSSWLQSDEFPFVCRLVSHFQLTHYTLQCQLGKGKLQMCAVGDGVLLQLSMMYACVSVALIFAYTAKCVTTRQVRRPLVHSELSELPCPTELEALFLVCTSAPLVPLDSAPGRRGNSSNRFVVARACFLVVH